MPTLLLALTTALAGPPPDQADLPTPCTDRDAGREVRRIARSDQQDRKNWSDGMEARDAERLAAVHALLAEGRICKPKTAFAAGVVLQHSPKRADFAEAHRLFRHALDQGHEPARRWAALAWDRFLVSGGEPQWFGTQRQGQHADDGSFLFQCLVAVDPAATDTDRAAYGVEALAEQIAGVYTTNGKPVPDAPTLAQLEADGLVCEPFAWGE